MSMQATKSRLCTTPPSLPGRDRGMSLVEVMVAMVIGLVLMIGATDVYISSRKTYETNEAVARLQETARFAVSVIEPDVRKANYWGYLKVGGRITGFSPQTAAADATVTGGAVSTQCGSNFAIDLQTNVEGNNNGYALACAASGAGAVTSADTLTIRRVSAVVSSAPAAAPVIRVCSTRTGGALVNAGGGCLAPLSQMNDLVVNTYYVDRDSDEQVGLPSLRRWSLGNVPITAAAGFFDNEIVPGVEDMQVQFGIDTGTGSVTQYVDAAGPIALNGAQVLAVRIWLLVRAERAEPGFVDNRTYVYGDRLVANGTTATLNGAGAAGKAYAPKDGFRRLLVSRTIMIRNEVGI